MRADLGVADGHRLLFALFGDVTHATARSTSTDPVSGGETDDLVTFDDVSGSGNGAVEYQGDFGAGVHATAGVVAFVRTSYQPGLSPRLSLSWRSGAFDVDARYGEGVRAPDRFDVSALAKAVVDGRVVGADGNPDLRPELVRTLQLGGGWSPSSALRISARAFALRHEDAVVAAQDGALLRPENLPPRLLAGADVSGDAALFDDVVHVRGGVASVHAVDGSDDRDGVDSAVFDANVAVAAGVVVGARGRAALLDPKDAAVVDLYGSADVADRFVLIATWKNAFDALELARDDDAPPFADPVRYPGPGRSFTVSLEAHF